MEISETDSFAGYNILGMCNHLVNLHRRIEPDSDPFYKNYWKDLPLEARELITALWAEKSRLEDLILERGLDEKSNRKL